MRRAFAIAAALSALLLALVSGVCLWAVSPQTRRSQLDVTGSFHVSLDDYGDGLIGHVTVFNDTEFNSVCRRIIPQSGVVAIGEGPGVRFWYYPMDEGGGLWTVAVSLWYPIVLFAAMPAIWLVRALARRRFRFSLRTLLLCPLLVALFFGSWGLTRWWGIPDVLEHEDSILGQQGDSLTRVHYLWLFGLKLHLAHWDAPGWQMVGE